jgi:hypothetical protein
VDITTRRKKQRKLMAKLVERKVRSRAQQLYETRGHEDGRALEDWVQAESEVLGDSVLAPLYHRVRTENQEGQEAVSASDAPSQDSSACETPA